MDIFDSSKKPSEKKQGEIQPLLLLSGVPASPGIASGPVKIVSNLLEMHKVSEGDILVLVPDEYDPDFVPAMKRAAAIVTDRWGRAASSAVISRALGIPCVTGTEMASKVLKDNEVVTVDGNNGKVYASKARRWQVGDRIQNRYQIYHIRGGPGKSGMGIVYLCYDHGFKEPVAIKTLQDRFFPDRTSLDRFKWEAEAWVKLEKHNNIVHAKYVQEIERRPYVFLEYVVGDERYGADLSGWIYRGGLSLPLTLNFAIQFCYGMIHADSKFKEMGKPFVHRDIKPSNIMITRDKVVKITDFGLVKAFSESGEDISSTVYDDGSHQRLGLSKSGSICGTPPYMSPEQCRGEKNIDARSDIYSFGCILYEMVTRKYVFDVRTPQEFIYHHLMTVPKSPNAQKELNRVIMKCLQKDPNKRFQNFYELEDILSELYQRWNGATVKRLDVSELSIYETLNKAQSLDNLGLHQEAIECYLQIMDLHPEFDLARLHSAASSAVNYALGRFYHKQSKLEDAIEAYKQFLKLTINDHAIHVNLALVYEDQGNIDEAIGEYKEALKVEPDYRERKIHAGISASLDFQIVAKDEGITRIYEDKDSFNEAIRKFKQHREAFRLDPDDPAAPYDQDLADLALVLEYHGRSDDAIREYKEVLKLYPNNTTTHVYLALLYKDEGRFDEAIREYKDASIIDPSDARTHIYLALLYEDEDRLDEAIREYKVTLRIDRDDNALHYARGCIYLKYHKYDEAVVEFKETLRLNPNNALAFYNLGLAYQGQWNSEEATKCYRDFIRLGAREYALFVRYVEEEIGSSPLRPVPLPRLRQQL